MAIVSGCLSDKEFLTEQVRDRVTTLNAFETSDQVLNTIFTGYYDMSEMYFPNGSGMGIRFTKTAGTDIFDGKYQLGAGSHMSNIKGAWSTDKSVPKNFWDAFYKIISYSNLAISQLDNVSWTSNELKARVEAEALFLRGVCYLRLAELYGGVPLVLEYSEVPDFGYTRATRVETYNTAINDLKAAYNTLPSTLAQNESGRASKWAAAFYLSEAYLALGVEENDNKTDFDNSAKYAQEVLTNRPLMTERFGVRLPGATGENFGIPNADPTGTVYKDLFVSANVIRPENTEAIWIMESAPDYASYAMNKGRRFETYGLSPSLKSRKWRKEYEEPGAGPGPWATVSAKYGGKLYPAFNGGTGWAQYCPTSWACYYNWEGDGNNNTDYDMRYDEDVTVRTKFICTDPNHSLYEQKCGWEETDSTDPNRATTIFPIFYKETPLDAWDYDMQQPTQQGPFVFFYRHQYAARSAEAALLLAEAKYRGGDTAGAIQALNIVRNRAKATPFTTISIDIILDERARELLYEEFRWATFLRMKPSEWKHRIYDYGMYSARADAPSGWEYRRWPDFTGEIEWNLWPIPQTYIDLNSESDGMPQNPGWKE
ncbi:MAG: RagB/SusD family nutrient uptake outer membrane protein [Bacteroidales bacterium]|nr:RagB/SusD family nutrient uptake outer membrane protein [Bacteroidales bacterium]